MVKSKQQKENVWNIPNFLPERPDTEDDASIDSHLKALADQEKHPAVKQEKDVMRDAMDMTQMDRCKLIIEERGSLGHIKDTYPTLFQEEQVLIYIL